MNPSRYRIDDLVDPAGTPAAEFTLCDREEMSPSRSVGANYVPNHEEVNLAPHGRLKSDIINMNGKGRLLKVFFYSFKVIQQILHSTIRI